MTAFGTYSRYYNLLYQEKDYPGEATFVGTIVDRHASEATTILDLGCGTGKHAFLLAGMGFEVIGVDISAQMLEVAAAEIEAAPAPRPRFLQGDIRTLRLQRTFDVVVSLFHVMSYQTTNEDLAAAFATARAHLKPGGLFIFDCWYGPAVLTDRPAVRVKRVEDGESALTRIVEPVLYPNQNVVQFDYHLFDRKKRDGAVEEVKERHRMRYLFRPEVDFLARSCGLSVLECFEWMTGREPGCDTWGVCFVVRG